MLVSHRDLLRILVYSGERNMFEIMLHHVIPDRFALYDIVNC